MGQLRVEICKETGCLIVDMENEGEPKACCVAPSLFRIDCPRDQFFSGRTEYCVE